MSCQVGSVQIFLSSPMRKRSDLVTDFEDDDRIDLRAVASISSFDDLQGGAARDSAEGVRIDTGDGEILIADLALANLDLTDFLF
jgi:hypothetical protein